MKKIKITNSERQYLFEAMTIYVSHSSPNSEEAKRYKKDVSDSVDRLNKEEYELSLTTRMVHFIVEGFKTYVDIRNEKIEKTNPVTTNMIKLSEKFKELLPKKEDYDKPIHFIDGIIQDDLVMGKHDKIITRFPPEPNGRLHLGHARAIITNHEMGKKYGGKFNLRFDDTNPIKEDQVFIDSMKEDIAWLGCDWDELLFASDYFDMMLDKARLLIQKGLAYVDDLTIEETREYRGTITEPGKNSPYRNRLYTENLVLFEQMIKGDFNDGARTLRAKIDMGHPNMNMRDPVIYRIQRAHHIHLGKTLNVYPMYDFAHPLEDAFEGITHSLCSLEFEDHRPLYDWVVDNCDLEHKPRQIEFGKLYISETISGKRHIKNLVDQGIVDGWDDPRLITLSGLRKKGIPPQAIRKFILELGLPKSQGLVEMSMLYKHVREELQDKVFTVNAVIDPLELIIENYPEGESEELVVSNNKNNGILGVRTIPFSRKIFIERGDFIEVKPNKKWKRLSLGREVRLMNAYFVKANRVDKDNGGNIIRVYCTYDPETKSGSGFKERKPDGNIHFVDGNKNNKAYFRHYDNLLLDYDKKDTNGSLELKDNINNDSKVVHLGYIEESEVIDSESASNFQFIRIGYYKRDGKDNGIPVFNQITPLRDRKKK